jgi:hypothetical protein
VFIEFGEQQSANIKKSAIATPVPFLIPFPALNENLENYAYYAAF